MASELFDQGNVIISLVIAGALIVMFLAVSTHEAFSGELFRETVYATDNALLAESLQTVSTGTIRYAYLLNQPNYVFSLDNGVFTVMNERREGSPTQREFWRQQQLEVRQATISPRAYELGKSDEELFLTTIVQADNCPQLAGPAQWPEDIISSGEALAGRALRDGLLREIDDLERIEHLAQRQDSFLRVDRDGARNTIAHDGSTQHLVLACLVQQELLKQEIRAIIQAGSDASLHLTVREEEDATEIERALACALRSFASGGRDEC